MPQRPTFELFLLTWTSGIMDALSYLRAGVFTANMTGNTVLLGLAMAGRDRSRFMLALASVLAFALGALIAGSVLARSNPRTEGHEDLKLGTALELPFVAVFVVLTAFARENEPYPMSIVITALGSISLGIQSAAVRHLQIAGIATTFISGTLTTAMLFLAAIEAPGSRERPRGSPLLLGAIFVSYFAAAAVGAVLLHRSKVIAALLPLVAVIAVQVRVRRFSRT